jgi:hypothetical protein
MANAIGMASGTDGPPVDFVLCPAYTTPSGATKEALLGWRAFLSGNHDRRPAPHSYQELAQAKSAHAEVTTMNDPFWRLPIVPTFDVTSTDVADG